MSEIDTELLATFIVEALDLASDWEAICLRLEKSGPKNDVDALFRVAHTLKGSSRAVGLEAFGSFVHQAEDVITHLKKGALEINNTVIQTLLDTQNCMVNWLQKLENDLTTHPSAEIASLVARFKELINQSKTDNYEATPHISNQKENNSNNNGSTEKLVDPLGNFVGEIFGDDPPATTNAPEVVEGTPPSLSFAVEKKPEEKSAEKKGVQIDYSIRVAASKIDGLMQLVGEMATQQAIVAHGQKENFTVQSRNAINACNKLTKQLQKQVLGLRMQTVQGLFQRLERTVKDIAREQQKLIEVNNIGLEVELDKVVLDKISDAMSHIVRNSVDHGIENQAQRESAAKNPTAQITFHAQTEANGVVISVSDDGKGLPEDKILAKAIDKGIVKPGQKLSKEQVYQLIFAPGFSTAEKITAISGRGVGLDVVRRSVEELGGNVEVRSELGKGTTFRITLPTNISIMDTLEIKLLGQTYVVPLQEVWQIVDLSNEACETTGGKNEVATIFGKAVSIVDLRQFFAQKQGNVKKNLAAESLKKTSPVLLIDYNQTTLGLRIDEIFGQQSIVVRKITGKAGQIFGFSGATILPSGEPVYILSPFAIAKHYLAKFNHYSKAS